MLTVCYRQMGVGVSHLLGLTLSAAGAVGTACPLDGEVFAVTCAFSPQDLWHPAFRKSR